MILIQCFTDFMVTGLQNNNYIMLQIPRHYASDLRRPCVSADNKSPEAAENELATG